MREEPKPMREIHEIREKLNKENKNLSHREHIAKVHREAEEFQKKYGLTFRQRVQVN